MSIRQALWAIALLLLVLAGILHYSPRLSRHTPALLAFGMAAFVLGWLTRGQVAGG